MAMGNEAEKGARDQGNCIDMAYFHKNIVHFHVLTTPLFTAPYFV
jgi:hypothetical protein